MEGDRHNACCIHFDAISIHSLRMEGDLDQSHAVGIVFISIHSLRMEGDGKEEIMNISDVIISIHSLRMEGDPANWEPTSNQLNFNPLPPHGGRRHCVLFWNADRKFQSTPSAWRETVRNFHTPDRLIISIHSLRMEGDRSPAFRRVPPAYFNPLPPHGGRLTCSVSRTSSFEFQSTPSAWRETIFL